MTEIRLRKLLLLKIVRN